jgi:hypothetical protein
MRLRANLILSLAGALAAAAMSAAASTIDFGITYTTLSGTGCSISCFSLPSNLLPPPYTFDFSLDSAQLAADGSYDISSFIDPLLFVDQPGASSTLTALAIVSGGIVTDATIAFSETYPVPLLNSTAEIDYNASGGAFTNLREVSIVSTDLTGVYSIAELPPATVPEPATFAVVATGLALLLLRRKRRS